MLMLVKETGGARCRRTKAIPNGEGRAASRLGKRWGGNIHDCNDGSGDCVFNLCAFTSFLLDIACL